MIFNNMKIRKNNHLVVRKNPYLLKIHPGGNPHHEANVPSYSIGIGELNDKGGGTTCFTPEMTLDDLKELRKVIRKVIKDESY